MNSTAGGLEDSSALLRIWTRVEEPAYAHLQRWVPMAKCPSPLNKGMPTLSMQEIVCM